MTEEVRTAGRATRSRALVPPGALVLALLIGCSSAVTPDVATDQGAAPSREAAVEALLTAAMPVTEDLGEDVVEAVQDGLPEPQLELLGALVPPDPCDSAVVEPLAGQAPAGWTDERTGRLLVDAPDGGASAVVVTAYRFADAVQAQALVQAVTERAAGCAARERGPGHTEAFLASVPGTPVGALEPLTTYGWDVETYAGRGASRYAWLAEGSTALRVAVVATDGAPAPDVRLVALRVRNRVFQLDREVDAAEQAAQQDAVPA